MLFLPLFFLPHIAFFLPLRVVVVCHISSLRRPPSRAMRGAVVVACLYVLRLSRGDGEAQRLNTKRSKKAAPHRLAELAPEEDQAAPASTTPSRVMRVRRASVAGPTRGSRVTRPYCSRRFFKLPRSGSSWVTSLVQAPALHITEEVITGKRSQSHGVAECEAHLKLALLEPVGKVGSVDAVARLAERAAAGDVARPLCARPRGSGAPCLACVGFTLNPNRKPDVDYVAVAKSAPDVRVVVFLRTNRVKAAISRVRGKLLDSVCGYNNIRVGKRAKDAPKTPPRVDDPRADMSTGHCKLAPTLAVNVSDVRDALVVNWNWEKVMLDTVATLRAEGLPVLQISYEEFLGDRDAALGRLFDFLAVPADARPESQADVYEKATSDDLKSFVPNYAAIDAWLAESAPCLLPHLRATDPGLVFDQTCENPWPEVAAGKKAEKKKQKKKRRVADEAPSV